MNVTIHVIPTGPGGGANLLFAVGDFLTQHICSDFGFPPTARCVSDNFDHKDFYKDRALLKMKHFGIFVPLFRGIDGKLANRSFLLSVTSGKKIEGGEQICRLCLAPGKNLLTCGRKSVFRGGSKNFFAPGNRPVGMG